MSVRIDGAPALVTFDKLTTVIGLSLAYTKFLPGRFERFADRVLGPGHSAAAGEELKAQLNALIAAGEEIGKLTADVTRHDVEEGFGRLDALTRIGNQVFSTDMLTLDGGDPAVNQMALDNMAPIVAPVNFPHIWDTSWFDWVQYDASIMQPMVRNAGEALGVAAKINLTVPGPTLYRSTVTVDNVYQMEALLAGPDPLKGTQPGFRGLKAPAWPESVLGAIDPARHARGATLYADLCQGCHLPPIGSPAFWTDQHWKPIPGAVGRYLAVPAIPVDEVGTDPGQASILPNRTVQLPAFLGVDPSKLDCPSAGSLPTGVQSETLFAFALGYVVQETADTWYADHDIPADRRFEMNGRRPNCLRAEMVYKARPLDGVWATAPFLHNGSVPTLYDLLSPVADRPAVFQVGNRQFDPLKVGYDSGPLDGTFTLDTATAGNSNAGHEFRGDGSGAGVIGRGLSPDERLDLVEFLKRPE